VTHDALAAAERGGELRREADRLFVVFVLCHRSRPEAGWRCAGIGLFCLGFLGHSQSGVLVTKTPDM